jgi:hypothetical protein
MYMGLRAEKELVRLASTFLYHNIVLVSRKGGGIEPTPP